MGERDAGFVALIDLNETLIRTGELTPEQRTEETRQLNEFSSLCKKATSRFPWMSIVFMTGNSFEYSRRIEEPLGLKNLPRAEVVVVSENGLIGRSFKRGDLWRYEPLPEYASAVESFMSFISQKDELTGSYYTQGNEIRVTLKPVHNAFCEFELQVLKEAAEKTELQKTAQIYFHAYYFDIDPLFVQPNTNPIRFKGKHAATTRLLEGWGNARILAVGDSSSDIPMFQAALEAGGSPFWVANRNCDEEVKGVQMLSMEYTAGVNEAIQRILE